MSSAEERVNLITSRLKADIDLILKRQREQKIVYDEEGPFNHPANTYTNARNGTGFKVTHNGQSAFGLLFKKAHGDKNSFIHIPLRRWELRSVLTSVVRHLERGDNTPLRFGFEEKEIPGIGLSKVYSLTFKLNYDATVTVSIDETTTPSDTNNTSAIADIPWDSTSTEMSTDYLGMMSSRSDVAGPKWKILAIVDYFKTLISLIDSTR